MKTSIPLIVAGLIFCLIPPLIFGQQPSSAKGTEGIYGPEGMNITGAMVSWTDPPPVPDLAGIETGGNFLLDSTSFWRRYHTIIHIPSDFAAGTYDWLFTSGPSGGYFNNKWNPVTVAMDSIQTYNWQGGGTNNSVTVAGGYYTVNFRDNGYAAAQAIWIQTDAQPVAISTVSRSPLTPTASVVDTITMVTSAAKSSQENFFIRYSTDNFATSTVLPVTFAADSMTATAIIPGQSGGTTVTYYAFSSKLANPSSDFDLITIQFNNNGNANYSYTIPAANYTINASGGPHGLVAPSGAVSVVQHGNQTFTFTPDAGYYVDTILVDNTYAGDSSSYTFTNVTSNHTISVTFAHNVNVTFQVDMALMIRLGKFAVGTDTVSVNGTFNGYAPKVDLLTDPNNDSVYTLTKSIRANSHIEYKFWKSRGPLNWEDDISNRTFDLGDTSVTLAVVFFDNQLFPVNVTFRVDMSIQKVQGSFLPASGDAVVLRGSFDGWAASTDTLHATDAGDSIYTVTVGIPGLSSNQYKFWKTLRNGTDYEVVGGNPVMNRNLTVGLGDSVLPLVYFSDDNSQPTSTISLTKGWNMVSVPRIMADYTKSALFPAAVSNAFAYNGASYIILSTLKNGPGYWVKLGTDTTTSFTGAPRTNATDTLTPGWNMIGTLSGMALTSSISVSPGGAVISKYFGYAGGYKISDTLRPGQGYWVKVDTAATLTLNANGPAAKRAAQADPTSGFDAVTLTDAAGRSQTLYLSHDKSSFNASNYELPPSPFAEAFDIRFASNRYAELTTAGHSEHFTVAVSGATLPVTVSWNVRTASSQLDLNAGKSVIAMKGQGSVRLNDLQGLGITVGASRTLPKAYALSQNYPNPFNPTTNIVYDLPERSVVQIVVFNILGERVAELASGVQDAGEHAITWNASVASGVYFYSIKATSTMHAEKSFQSVRKMLLMR